ncbi:hypothetical protein C8Q74DRAFT_270595 [Fomes fomentarius]|nr:hypothetical protein C8Q74DRAFT_270595 [Fomes fomentarius]
MNGLMDQSSMHMSKGQNGKASDRREERGSRMRSPGPGGGTWYTEDTMVQKRKRLARQRETSPRLHPAPDRVSETRGVGEKQAVGRRRRRDRGKRRRSRSRSRRQGGRRKEEGEGRSSPQNNDTPHCLSHASGGPDRSSDSPGGPAGGRRLPGLRQVRVGEVLFEDVFLDCMGKERESAREREKNKRVNDEEPCERNNRNREQTATRSPEGGGGEGAELESGSGKRGGAGAKARRTRRLGAGRIEEQKGRGGRGRARAGITRAMHDGERLGSC